MIEINLLPEELKLKTKKRLYDIRFKKILYLTPLISVILIIIHLGLAGSLIIRNFQLRNLHNKWKSLGPQKKLVDDFKTKYHGLSQEAKMIQQLTGQRVNWAEKLNKLSLNLPSGIWFNEIQIGAEVLILKASVISLQKEEMRLINAFIDNLKNDKDFFRDFNNLELNSAQKKVIGGYDVTDFILVGTLSEAQTYGTK